MKHSYQLNKVACAIGLSLLATANITYAQQDDEAIEEVVVKATRLQGSAAAVIEERKNQAFVADILGAEQLARTGDSDAASALRRVTGLTLVDGKFIYVRGLGERYSSARLNGASIPSPDLTRNVIPLDIFPSSIIESLSVQKAYSPSMPAAFGGGAIDIRTKSVPKEFTAGFELGIGKDSNSSSGFTYNRNDNGVPSALSTAIIHYKGDFSLGRIIARDGLQNNESLTAAQQATAINKTLLMSLPRNMVLTDESLDPNYSIKANIGDTYREEFFGGDIGFLAAVAYDSKWNYSDRRQSVISDNFQPGCATELNSADDVANSCFNTLKDSQVTTENERLNGVFNLGYSLDGHQVSWSKMYLEDNEDETEIAILQSPNGSNVDTIAGNNQAQRFHEFNYEERTLEIDQFIGKHTFLDLGGLGFDWQYTESSAETEIPVDVKYEFEDTYDNNGVYQSSAITGDDNRVVYSFVDLEDRVKSYSGNLNLPVYVGNFEMEFKLGYDFADKARLYNTSSFAVNNKTGVLLGVNQGQDSVLGVTGFLTDQLIDDNAILLDFNEPTPPDADDYLAGQKIDAGYGAFDLFYKGTWRISGGIRYEEFKQVSLATSSLIFGKRELDIFFSQDKIQAGTIIEDDFYPALSFTYVKAKYQLRFGYGETVVRPDLREVVPVAYFDPLTDIRTIGRIGLKSSNLKNYDARFEFYAANGDNYTFGAFYKDIENPIESVLSIGDEDYTLTFINGDTAEVYGVEAEWLHDTSYLVDGTFASGNITLSDSEVSINPALAGNLTNPTKRMTGHSKYVVNFQLGFDSANGKHSGSLVYNVFGERILASGVGGREDAFEQPFHSLDAVYTFYPDFNSKVKLRVKNLLGEDQEVTQSDIQVRTKSVGTEVSLSYSYEF